MGIDSVGVGGALKIYCFFEEEGGGGGGGGEALFRRRSFICD